VGTLERQAQSQTLIAKAHELKEDLASLCAARHGHHLLATPQLKAELDRRRRDLDRDLQAFRALVADNDQYRARLAAAERELTAWLDGDQDDFDLRARVGQSLDAILAEENRELDRRQEEVAADHARERVGGGAGGAGHGAGVVPDGLGLARQVTRPIDRLRDAVARLPRGEFEVVPPSGPTEIEQLTRGFNLMGLALAERQTLLQTSEHRYRTVVGQLYTILWTTDAAGVNADLSGWVAFTGQTPTEAAGDGWLEAVHPEDRARFAAGWAAALAAQTPREEEVRVAAGGRRVPDVPVPQRTSLRRAAGARASGCASATT